MTVPQALWLLLCGAFGGGFIVLLLTRLLAREEGRAGMREIIRALEDMSEGRLDRLPPADEGEPMAPVAAALSTLAEALRRRAAEQERQAVSLRSLLDSARGVAFIGTDEEGNVVFSSEGVRELLGFAPEEIRARSVSRLFTEESWEQLAPKLSRRALREGGGIEEKARVRRRGGGEIAVHLSVAVGLEEGNRVLFYTIRDATDAENLERELRESEEKYRRLAEGLTEGAFVIQDGLIVYANRSLEQLVGAEGSLRGRPFRDLIASEDLLRVMDLIAETEAANRSTFFDCRVRSLGGGSTIEAGITLSPARLSGRPAVIGSLRQVGAERRSLRQLEASQARLDATLEATSDGILMLSGPPGRQSVAVANRRLGEIVGLDTNEVFRLSAAEIAARLAGGLKDSNRFMDFFHETSASTDLSRRELFDLSGPGGRVLEILSSPAAAGEGSVVGRVFSFRDVSGREDLARSKQGLEEANAELARVNTVLQQRTAELDRINQELRSLDQMKSALLANVSHELQTPLVSIKGYTEMILKGKLGSITEEQRRGLEISLRNIDRLISMIENLLALSRTEKELPAMEVATFPLWDLVEECVQLVREEADKRRVTLTTRYLTDDLTVRADRGKIAQVFLNLVSNAIKFNREGGEVSLSVRRGKRGYLLVEVRDTGIGIPPDALDRIFDRHYRVASPEARAREGQGLGLAIVKDILRLHGCMVRADSRVGEGSVFTFTLPLAASTVERLEGMARGEPGGEPPAQTPLGDREPSGRPRI